MNIPVIVVREIAKQMVKCIVVGCVIDCGITAVKNGSIMYKLGKKAGKKEAYEEIGTQFVEAFTIFDDVLTEKEEESL